jgi:hypothetical protein
VHDVHRWHVRNSAARTSPSPTACRPSYLKHTESFQAIRILSRKAGSVFRAAIVTPLPCQTEPIVAHRSPNACPPVCHSQALLQPTFQLQGSPVTPATSTLCKVSSNIVFVHTVLPSGQSHFKTSPLTHPTHHDCKSMQLSVEPSPAEPARNEATGITGSHDRPMHCMQCAAMQCGRPLSQLRNVHLAACAGIFSTSDLQPGTYRR